MFSRKALAVTASAAAVFGGIALSASSADASTQMFRTVTPFVAPAPFTNNSVGEAGVLITDDGHTRYREVQSTLKAQTLLATLNDGTSDGAGGVEFCNPNTGFAAQIGLFYDSTTEKFYAAYADGYFNDGAVNADTDVCASGGLLDAITETATLPDLTPATPVNGTGPNFVLHSGVIPVTVSKGDNVQVQLYYNPFGKNHFVEFTVVDQTTGWIRNPQVRVSAQNLYEAGAGALTPTITSNAFNAVEPINETSVDVNYYSSAKPAYGIFDATSYSGTGGLVDVSATNGAATLAPTETSVNSFTLTSSES